MPDPELQSVSASQIPALFETHHQESRYTLWHKFAGIASPRIEQTPRMRWGKLMEDLIYDEASEWLRAHRQDGGDITIAPSQKYARRGSVGCTKDALIYSSEEGVFPFEVKTCFDDRIWYDRWQGGKEVPPDVDLQHQVQMHVGDNSGQPYEKGLICCWYAAELYFFDRKYRRDVAETLESQAAAFLKSVNDNERPDPTGTPADYALLVSLYPERALNRRFETEDPLLYDAAQTLIDAPAARSRAQKAYDYAKQQVLAAMEEAPWGAFRSGDDRPDLQVRISQAEMAGRTQTVRPHIRTLFTAKPIRFSEGT